LSENKVSPSPEKINEHDDKHRYIEKPLGFWIIVWNVFCLQAICSILELEPFTILYAICSNL